MALKFRLCLDSWIHSWLDTSITWRHATGASLFLILLRHATRSAFSESGESILNADGHRQAADFVLKVRDGAAPPPTRLVSSPRLRALQTLAPLSESTHLKTDIVEELDERHNHETQSAFEVRVRKSFDVIRETFAKAPGESIYV